MFPLSNNVILIALHAILPPLQPFSCRRLGACEKTRNDAGVLSTVSDRWLERCRLGHRKGKHWRKLSFVLLPSHLAHPTPLSITFSRSCQCQSIWNRWGGCYSHPWLFAGTLLNRIMLSHVLVPWYGTAHFLIAVLAALSPNSPFNHRNTRTQ